MDTGDARNTGRKQRGNEERTGCQNKPKQGDGMIEHGRREDEKMRRDGDVLYLGCLIPQAATPRLLSPPKIPYRASFLLPSIFPLPLVSSFDPVTMSSNLSSSDAAPPSAATNAVLVSSGPVPEGAHQVRGVDFDRFQGRDITVAEMVDNMADMGFQGSAVADAASVLNDMVFPTGISSCSAYLTALRPSVHIATPKRERRRLFS